MSKVIKDKKEAGKFAAQVIEANIKQFEKIATPKEAYNHFKNTYPNVNISYDNFWYHLGKVKKNMGIVSVSVTGNNKTNDDLALPEMEIIPQVTVDNIEIKLYKPKEETAPTEIFEPYKSGTFIDTLFSTAGGAMPGTTVVATGDASVGKTTTMLYMLRCIKNFFLSTLKKKADKLAAEDEFIYFSSEMKRIDIQSEEAEKPWWKDFNSILLNEYPKEQYKALVEKVLTHGYRVIVFDSFQDTVSRLNAFSGMTEKEASQFILKCIERANMGDTTTGHNTTIILIQQVTKSGVFVGKNNLKHDTTAMLEFKFDKDNNKRYCYFSKNRRNGSVLWQKLYYGLDENREVTFDTVMWNEDRAKENLLKENQEQLETARKEFDSVFVRIGTEEDEAE